MRFINLIILSVVLCSCGTIRHHTDNPEPELYGGTKEDFKTLGHVNGPISGVLVIIDIPLSIIADTLMGIGSIFISSEETTNTTAATKNEEEKQ